MEKLSGEVGARMGEADNSWIRGGGVTQRDQRRTALRALLHQPATRRRAAAVEHVQPLPCFLVGRSAA
ncbi:hypothetical protein E2562_026948 [Oryza meyeriana var. granulata]|uniref:Uncharacterized protein n=1 Tax=Oryza meyeriana var. granulata TaxID=110450 RepID=A0A6G1BP34_9ORYZ|nr:hypothetical protein E2562_026948 [Oryza meyeriana var. granulata]